MDRVVDVYYEGMKPTLVRARDLCSLQGETGRCRDLGRTCSMFVGNCKLIRFYLSCVCSLGTI